MKILALSAGTHNGRNDAMATLALRGAKAHGAEVELIHLLDLDLKPCIGCQACVLSLLQGGTGGCIMKDDMEWLDEKILEADGIIFALPIFEKGTPAVFDIIQDRIFGPSHDIGILTSAKEIAERLGEAGPDPRRFKSKPVSLIAIGGSDWMTRVSSDFNIATMVPMWKVIDEVILSEAGAIFLEKERMEQCYKVGEHIVQAVTDFENAAVYRDPGVCPHCASRNFYFYPNGMVECDVCGIKGKIRETQAGYTFEFDEKQLLLAHDTIPGKLKHLDDINNGVMKYMSTDYVLAKRAFEFDIKPAKPNE